MDTGGVCAIHEDEAATGNCARCGDFVCGRCLEDGAHAMCLACRERTGIGAFPLTRETTDVSSVLNVAWAAFKQQGVLLSLAVVSQYALLFAVYLVFFAVTLLAPGEPVLMAVSLALFFAGYLVSNLMILGQIRLGFDVLDGKKPDLRELGWQMKRTLPFLAIGVLLTIAILPIYAVLFVAIFAADSLLGMPDLGALVGFAITAPVLAYVFSGVGFATWELVFDPRCGPIEALSRSWTVISGKRWMVIGLGLLLMVFWYAGALCCYLGLPPAQAFSIVALCAAYRGLRRGADVPDVGLAPD